MCPYCESFIGFQDLRGITGWCLHYLCSHCQRSFVTTELSDERTDWKSTYEKLENDISAGFWNDSEEKGWGGL